MVWPASGGCRFAVGTMGKSARRHGAPAGMAIASPPLAWHRGNRSDFADRCGPRLARSRRTGRADRAAREIARFFITEEARRATEGHGGFVPPRLPGQHAASVVLRTSSVIKPCWIADAHAPSSSPGSDRQPARAIAPTTPRNGGKSRSGYRRIYRCPGIWPRPRQFQSACRTGSSSLSAAPHDMWKVELRAIAKSARTYINRAPRCSGKLAAPVASLSGSYSFPCWATYLRRALLMLVR